jgi:hypothetical protein
VYCDAAAVEVEVDCHAALELEAEESHPEEESQPELDEPDELYPDEP